MGILYGGFQVGVYPGLHIHQSDSNIPDFSNFTAKGKGEISQI